MFIVLLTFNLNELIAMSIYINNYKYMYIDVILNSVLNLSDLDELIDSKDIHPGL